MSKTSQCPYCDKITTCVEWRMGNIGIGDVLRATSREGLTMIGGFFGGAVKALALQPEQRAPRYKCQSCNNLLLECPHCKSMIRYRTHANCPECGNALVDKGMTEL